MVPAADPRLRGTQVAICVRDAIGLGWHARGRGHRRRQMAIHVRGDGSALRDRTGRVSPGKLEGWRQHSYLSWTPGSLYGVGRVRFLEATGPAHDVRRE